MNPAFGTYLKLSVRGASHARAIRFALANFPAGFRLDRAALAAFMQRRAPGRDALSTSRRETDDVSFMSGVSGDVTDGHIIEGLIANRDIRPGDYGVSRTVPRPGHADYPQWVEQGRIPTGGGSNSGRLTAAICAAGGLCRQWLAVRGVSVAAVVDSVAGKTRATEMTAAIRAAHADGDSVGGTIRCTITGLPSGLGGPLFGGIESELSAAIFGIPGVKGVEFGSGFASTTLRGSAFNDAFAVRDGVVVTRTNRQGGLLGGRTSGMPITFRVALRPTPTVYRTQASVDLATLRAATLTMKGRHDPCIVRRAVPVVEAMAAFVLADILLADAASHPRICLTLTGRTLAENQEQFRAQRPFTDMVELRLDLLQPRERSKRKVAAFLDSLPCGLPVILTKDLDHTRFADGRAIHPLHDFSSPVPNLPKRLRELAGAKGDIAKIAFQPKHLSDVTRAFRELHAPNLPPHVVLAMGPLGLVSRVLAGRFGSLWTYCSVSGLEHLGHISPQELVTTYRFRAISQTAVLYGVTGWPLKKTRSPEIHNAAFAAEDEDAVMVPIPSETPDEALAFMRTVGMRGLAVTIPHKQTILPLLDRVDPTARRIGAVNTVALENGRLVGYNTDIGGFAEALTAFAGTVRGRRVAVLGDGGAAQAVKAALRQLKARFSVFHRSTPPQGFDILVNATPVDPIPDYVFTGHELVYDLGYVPEVTPLMARASAAGCSVSNGLAMLAAQARLQRRIWGL